MALTFAQLTAPAAIDDAADYNAALEAARLAKKQALYASLNSVGVQGVYSWATGSVPSSLVEIYAWSLFDYDLSQAYLALGALNSTAFSESGRGDDGQDGLSVLSREVYDNTRGAGLFTVCRIKLTDSAGNGPWTFQPNTVSFSDVSTVANTTYRYRVRASNAAGSSGYSAIVELDTDLPAAPTGLTATTVSATRIDLTWADASDNEESFRVERCAGIGCSDFVSKVNSTTCTEVSPVLVIKA